MAKWNCHKRYTNRNRQWPLFHQRMLYYVDGEGTVSSITQLLTLFSLVAVLRHPLGLVRGLLFVQLLGQPFVFSQVAP